MSSLTKAEGAGQRGQSAAYQQGYQSAGDQWGAQGQAAQGYGYQQSPNYGAATGSSDRPMTIDDVVTKTGITLGVIVVMAVVNFMIGQSNESLAMGLTFVGAIGGLIAVLVSSFGKKYGSPVVTLVYAAFEGLFVGGFTYIFAGVNIAGGDGGAMIFQAVLGTIGVFVGMLVVYKTGAIRVTPKFTKMLVGAMIGVLVLVLGNFVYALFTGEQSMLRDGGPIAIIFSLVCIVLAALSFLTDFDQADKLIRAGAPSRYAWGVALGLAVTLVWLYTEILRLLSYFSND
ncbi:MAG TPA: Bax inhibitor-1/YccA family protein [Candidatus Corynebacterium avicola]|uniref:Bax inhibitor-1/YccA family protein n=1 Tax=Candidatus Corynebacterium avicola TaxID=2838527 RepID=A0A9D1RMP5_9CORY|nr:Bax inhibitor-1/YccA family protein [Candidatus Corynebacterium avicola]